LAPISISWLLREGIMSEVTTGIVGVCVLLFLFFSGIELAFAMCVVGFAGYAFLVGIEGATTMIAKDMFETFTNYGYTVIPLFVLMGQVAFNAGIAKRLYDSAHRFMGHIPGGLALATVAGVTIFKSICGSATATTATFAGVAVPEMERYGYAKKLSTGVVAVAGTLGILLPPSVALILFGMITEQSIGRLFLAGFFPGLLLAGSYAAIVVGWCKLNPALGPRSPKYSWKERMESVPEVVWPIIIFVLMIGGMMLGVFTPTEAGGVGACAVLLLVLIRKELRAKGVVKSIVESLRTCCMVYVLILGSMILGHFLAVTNIPAIAAEWVARLPVHRGLIMVMISLIYLLGGSLIDDLAFMVLATPIFYPIILKLGYDPAWACIMICLTVVLGGVIPPVALNVFIVKNITKTPAGIIYAGVYPFLIAMVFLGILLFLFPQIALYLPQKYMN
jgi:C4-dicarboxylate transporter, DctM subunit